MCSMNRKAHFEESQYLKHNLKSHLSIYSFPTQPITVQGLSLKSEHLAVSAISLFQGSFEKKISSIVRCNVLHICQVQFIYSVVKSQMSLLMFCLDMLSIIENGVLNSPTILLQDYFSFSSVNVCFFYLGALSFGAYVLRYYFLMNLPFYHYIMNFFAS